MVHRHIWFGCVLTVLFVIGGGRVYAQEPAAADVRLVIDVSGSMKRNDPNNLRQPAVELLMRLLPEGSKAGVWTFGKYVNMLVPHKEVDEKWRSIAKDKAGDINSVGLFTNIGEALERAAHDAASPKSTHNTSIILLTDGMVDIDKSPEKNKAEWRRIADEVLPKLKNAGFTVHTIALSNNADKDLMQKLALSTDGTASVANNADDLLKIFLKAFDVAAPAQKVPLVDNSFVVDSSVEEFTALIFRQVAGEETKLIGPDEQVVSQSTVPGDIKWHRTDKYDLITVSQPLEGEWKVMASVDPDSRVTVVSNLNLRVKTLPSNVFRGSKQSLNFVLQEDGKTVTRTAFLQLLTNSVAVGYGPGDTPTTQKWQHEFGAIPQDGIYRKELPVLEELGTYGIQITVDGKTFKREYVHRLTVREPFTAEVKEGLDEQGQSQYVLTVRAHGQDILLNKTQIAVSIVNPKRRKFVKPLGLTDYDNWQTVLNLDMEGDYSIVVQVAGEDAKAEAFEYFLTPITISHKPDDIFSEPSGANVEPQTTQEPSPPEVKPEPLPEKVETKEESKEEPKDVEPKKDEPVSNPEESNPEEELPAEDKKLPKWVLYALLGLGNLLLLGGGFWMFKKLMGDSGEEDELDEPEVEETPEPEPAPEPEPEEDISMDDGVSDDEEPPMEDLGGGEEEEAVEEVEEVEEEEPPPMEDLTPEPEPLDEPEAEADDAPPELEDVVEADDFGLDDIDEDTDSSDEEALAQATEGESEESKEDFAKEMLKAQGLDLPEDELDDAISSLIDELDGERDGGDKDDFDDFDDFGLDDDKK